MSSRTIMDRIYEVICTLGVDPGERTKVIFTSLAFFLVIGAYTLAKELKDSLFVHIVGLGSVPQAKILSMIMLIPAILLYSRLVDTMKKNHLLYMYALVYGCVGVGIAYLLGHPTIGLANTLASPQRFFGWFIYVFLEGYSPFVVSLYWAFVNSITGPEAAKKNYPIMIAVSKVGGVIATALAVYLLRRDPVTHEHYFSDVVNHQILFGVSAFFLLCVPIAIYFLMKHVPAQSLHGYEAAYQAEKVEARLEKKQPWYQRLFSGISLLVKYPYAFGIFGMIFFWEVVNVVFAYGRLGAGKTAALSVSDYTRFLFEGALLVHMVGIVFVLLGTRVVVSYFGERRSLLLIPIMTGALVLYYLMMPTSPMMVIYVWVLIRAINYAFAYPLRESLYIPTTKEIRFKTKSWIDSFGTKAAKSCGSFYNMLVQALPGAFLPVMNMLFFGVIVALWFINAYIIGRRFERAVQHNEVIGLEKSTR